MAVKPGDILRDRLRIDALIGRGGMGHVFAATDLESRTQVAVKVVSRLLVDDVLMVRLHREAEAARRICSDFVPRVLEVNDTEGGETFLVMERLVGEPLSQRIRANGALPWSEVHRLGDDILCGLVDAHAARIVHRDLKPSNVFLALKDSGERAMVLDFGVCKMAGVDAERLTGTGESIGTVAYMAPEQIRGSAHVDERADLFAFGVLVFEMLSGRLPHDGPSQMAILASKLENQAPPLRHCSLVAIPEGVDELVMRALERDPAKRFASARELLTAWRALARTDAMMTGGAHPPRPADGVQTGGAEPPTEVSRPPPELLALSSESLADEIAGDSTYVPPRSRSSRHPSLPPEAHPTQTSLTTHHSSLHKKSGSGRVALLLAAFALVAGIVLVGVSFTRGSDAPSAKAASASSAGVAAAVAPREAPLEPAPSVGVGTEGTAPSSVASDIESFELPDDPTPAGAREQAKPKPRVRVRHPAAPKASGPRITSQPRY
ncbi:MAG: hypothetical protein BGO98_43595 [Myxococcales bacterium 68-20]|nr:MAG: hypothetical protein BGO98_43595 [Myxococcales bacterium 68-20]